MNPAELLPELSPAQEDSSAGPPPLLAQPSYRSAVITLCIDGDLSTFDHHGFKIRLAQKLSWTIDPRQIVIEATRKRSGELGAHLLPVLCHSCLHAFDASCHLHFDSLQRC